MSIAMIAYDYWKTGLVQWQHIMQSFAWFFDCLS